MEWIMDMNVSVCVWMEKWDGMGCDVMKGDQNNALSYAWMHLDAWILYTNFNTSNTHVHASLHFIHARRENERRTYWQKFGYAYCARCLNKVLAFSVGVHTLTHKFFILFLCLFSQRVHSHQDSCWNCIAFIFKLPPTSIFQHVYCKCMLVRTLQSFLLVLCRFTRLSSYYSLHLYLRREMENNLSVF